MKEVNLFALLFCNLFLRAQLAYFSSKPPPGVIKASIGQDVTIPWNFTLEAEEKLLLMQLYYSKTNSFETSAQRIAYRFQDTLSISKAFKGRVSVDLSGTLTLHNVTVEQKGFYKCDVSLTGQGQPVWDKAQLLVGTPPVIYSSPPSEITLLEDDHLDITCEASGSPVPNVSWSTQTKHGGWKKLSEHRLSVKNVKQSDSGYYKCSARNFMGSEEKTVKITVHERATVATFFHNSALDDTVYECDEITFTCEARGSSPPVKNIYIYHEGRMVHRSINSDKETLADARRTLLADGGRAGRLRIEKVRKEHGGKYYCVAENEHGLGYNKTIDLKVFAAPGNCERKKRREFTTEATTMLQLSSLSPTGVTEHSLPTTTKAEVQGKHSGSQIPRPTLFLFAIWILHFIFCSA